jgi:hypothetical protein
MIATTKPFISKKAGAGCRVREASFADHAQIATIESRYGLVPKPYAEWTHLWEGNPAYQTLPDWSIGWVVENHSGEIVGHIANIPSHMEFKGRRLLAASGSGLVVDEAYRSYAFPLFSQFLNQPNPDLIVNTSVNANGLNLHTLFHFQRVPSGAWNRSHFWITDYSNFAARMLTQRDWPGLLRYPVAVALAVKDVFHPSVPSGLSGGLQARWCDRFDKRFDEFWGRTQETSAAVLSSDRSSNTLNWHFNFPLAQGTAWIATVTDTGSKLLAYAVFLRQDNTDVALKRMRLVDFQTIDGNSEHLVPVLALALQKCREQEIHMLEAVGFAPDKQRVLARIAPHSREFPCWLYFYKVSKKNKLLAEELKDPAAWDPSPFDGDGSL